MNKLIALAFLLISASIASAQTITFPNYLSGLGSATNPTGSELYYSFQGGASKSVTGNRLVEGTLTSSGIYNVDLYGAVGNGSTDDRAAFAAALAACSAGGGGTVLVGPKRYLIDTVGLSVPTGCQLVCPAPMQTRSTPTQPVSTVKYAIIVNPAFTVTLLGDSSTSGCSYLQKNVASLTPATTRDFLNQQAAFTGNGITLGGGDISIRDTFIGGFTWGIIPGGETAGSLVPAGGATNTARLRLDHVNIDATNCVWLDQSHDVSTYSAVTCVPYLSSGFETVTGVTGPTYTITGIADNGAGLYRVTCSAACASATTTSSLIQTGDIVIIDGSSMVGAQSTRSNRWVATFVDATHIDLQGSSSAAKVITGTTISGNPGVTTLTSTTNIGSKNWVGTDTGPTITDSAGSIPGGTKVNGVAPGSSGLVLSANATGSTAGDTLTITDTAWASGGTIRISALARRGVAFYFTNSEFFSCHYCFAFGHDVGFKIGTGMDEWDCSNCMTDHTGNDPSTISIWISSASVTQGVRFTGGTFISQGQIIRAAGPGGGVSSGFTNMGVHANANSVVTPIEFVDSNIILMGVSDALVIARYLWVNSLVDSYNTAANNTGMTLVDVR